MFDVIIFDLELPLNYAQKPQQLIQNHRRPPCRAQKFRYFLELRENLLVHTRSSDRDGQYGNLPCSDRLNCSCRHLPSHRSDMCDHSDCRHTATPWMEFHDGCHVGSPSIMTHETVALMRSQDTGLDYQHGLHSAGNIIFISPLWTPNASKAGCRESELPSSRWSKEA